MVSLWAAVRFRRSGSLYKFTVDGMDMMDSMVTWFCKDKSIFDPDSVGIVHQCSQDDETSR